MDAFLPEASRFEQLEELDWAFGTMGLQDNEITIGLDYLPLEFIEKGKKNLTLKVQLNCDHQFFELKKDTTGNEVAKEWMDWFEGTSPIRLPKLIGLFNSV
ncbi:MAG: hypothetical protein ACOVOW_01180 [Spirosomataceae bacterium]